MKRIFVAGPMSTSGEPGPNVHQAAVAAADLLRAGFFPFVPHVTWVLHAICPTVPVSLWQKWDLHWLRTCHGLLRLPGESVGADAEVGLAREIEIPVFASVHEVVEYWP